MKAQERKMKQEAKVARAELATTKRKHKDMWSLKNVHAAGDKLHAAIKANQPVLGYHAPYCGNAPQICRDNQQLALKKKQQGEGEKTQATYLLSKKCALPGRHQLPTTSTVSSRLPCYITNNSL